MARLASPIEHIKPAYTVVIIGSGYGGSIAASRLARAGQQVCLLERGKEFQPGEYPDSLAAATGEMQTDLPTHHIGSRTGLYDLRVNDDINVFLGCGLGGTSLINANVSLRAEQRVFDDPRWPQAIRDDLPTLLEEGYGHAEEMLKPRPYPDDFPLLRKLQALEKSSVRLGEKFYRPPINVNFEDGVNHVGVYQQACTLCGDCCSGCNFGSKNTLIMNYLPDARNHGAEIFTQVSVRHIERKGNRWLVHYQVMGAGREKFDAPTMFVSAEVVILAAGALGSTEILLRSQEAGLPLSDMVGKSFTGNGDVLAFGYNNDEPINGVGAGQYIDEMSEPVGPCITGIIDIRERENLEEGMVIEEGVIPGALASLLPSAFAAAASFVGEDTDAGVADFAREAGRDLSSILLGSSHGAIPNTQTYLVMSHDGAAGHMHLKDDRLRIDWPGVGSEPIFTEINDRLEEATRALGGTYLRNPIWGRFFKKDLVTVHPLGGCPMGEDAAQGAVDHKGRVFSGNSGIEVYDGLYVCDGAIIPRSVGVNPLLTISAVAERNTALLARDRGWTIDYTLSPVPAGAAQSVRTGIQFTETMRGYFSTSPVAGYKEGWDKGKKEKSPFEFTLTIISDDLERMLEDQEHKARIVGTVTAPALSSAALTVTNGEFNLFVLDPEEPGTRKMWYRMHLSSEEGKTYYFEGFKVARDDPGLDLWSDTTTLYIRLHDGDSSGVAAGQGILKIRPRDFMRQMTTMQVKNAKSAAHALAANARFGRFFAGALFDTYGAIASSPRSPSRIYDMPPRKKRPLRVEAPEVHAFRAGDGVILRLTRYKGGDKGPVILSHGLGVSSLIFSTDTIETNMLEYLYQHEYDVWLLDHRASIDLPVSSEQYSADDIAMHDYPAAVSTVQSLTGAESVQMVAHCYGSTTFTMAMLGGLKGVRSAVCSQIGMHVKPPKATLVKTGLHMPTFLKALGVDSLTAYAGDTPDWQDKLYDTALKLLPIEEEERCTNPTCRRITFMYGPLYEHDQLSAASHESIHELFGLACIRAFSHLALMARKGHVVDYEGGEKYLPYVERMRIPITYIHGTENKCFLPVSTELTYNLLRERNGNDLYARHLIPGYGHIDCIFGKNAVRDVYPYILKHLEATL